jgi:uncharacterized protein
MALRAAALGFGAVFGFAISWGQFTDPDRIRDMLLLKDPYLYLMMATAVAVGFLGSRLLRRLRARAVLTGEPVRWETSRPTRRHVVGAALFGIGWSIADSCPAPIAGQLAQGALWSVFTICGVLLGVLFFLHWQERGAPGLMPGRLGRGATPRAPARTVP